MNKDVFSDELKHCTKNHISQVPENHGNFKTTKYIYIILPSTFWLKKDRISDHRKVQNKKFSVTSKYNLSINFLTQKKTVFLITKKFKTRTFQYSVNIFPSTFWLKTVFPISEKVKTRTFQ